MQLTSPRGNIVEKILRNPDGQLVRAVFCVYETYDGRVKARLLHTILLETESKKSGEVLALGGVVHFKKVQSEIVFNNDIKSPFVTTSIYFSGSKPRAPTANN